MDDSNRFKIRLESYSHGQTVVPETSIVFAVMPSLVESIIVEYQQMDPVHMPGSFYVYKGTKARTFDFGDLKFISRTSMEASENQAYVNFLRGWTRPYFGMGGNTNNAPSPAGALSPTKSLQSQPQAVRPLKSNEAQSLLQNKGSSAADPRVKFRSLGAPTAAEAQQKKDVATKAAVSKAFDSMGSEPVTLNSLGKPKTNNPLLTTKSTINLANSRPGNAASGTAASYDSKRAEKFLGAPPDVLYLTAYSDARDKGGALDTPTNIFRIPVIVTSLTITYPNDVDYIPTLLDQPFPIIMNISLSLAESHSPREYEKFDLFKYRAGRLPGF